MAKTVKSQPNPTQKMRPALTPEARENQCISLAMDLAEQQLRDGTASSQVITHFLQAGASRAELEKEKLRKENLMLEAKTKAYQSSEEIKELYEGAIKAMRIYQGQGDPDDYNEQKLLRINPNTKLPRSLQLSEITRGRWERDLWVRSLFKPSSLSIARMEALSKRHDPAR